MLSSGTLTDGHLTVLLPSTWSAPHLGDVEWADCLRFAEREVTGGLTSQQEVASLWATSAMVARVPESDRTSEEVGEDVWRFHRDNFYGDLTVTGEPHAGEVIAQDGWTGYKITGQVTVSGHPAGVKGDDVTILVIENADRSFSVLYTASTIDDSQSRAEVEAIWASFEVS